SSSRGRAGVPRTAEGGVTRSGTGNRVAQSAVLPAGPEEERGFVAVVSPAPKLDVVDGRLSACSVRNDMVELEEAPFATAPPTGGDEGATALISFRNRPFNVRGDISRIIGLAR